MTTDTAVNHQADQAEQRLSFMDRIPVEEITREAQQVNFGKALLTLVAGLLFGLAWLAGKFFRVFLVGAAFTVAAVKVGWKESTGQGPSKTDLIAQNKAMKLALQRMGGDVPR